MQSSLLRSTADRQTDSQKFQVFSTVLQAMSITLVYLCNISVAAARIKSTRRITCFNVCVSVYLRECTCVLACPALWPAFPFGINCSGFEYDKYSKSAVDHYPATLNLCHTPRPVAQLAYT